MCSSSGSKEAPPALKRIRRGPITPDVPVVSVDGEEVSLTALETRTVDTQLKRLREKLGNAGRWIETVRGVGYRMRDAS